MSYRMNALTAVTVTSSPSGATGRDAALCAQLASRVPAFVTAPTFVFGRDGAALPSRSEALRERIAVARGLV
ncbi:hypothetical protein [Sphingomonas sp. Leaf343]|uniref:hypothetical protein n=1 Tax=Sphingomonas sp. Leaf343 TaxID=1736345 RepID=UPI0006FF1F20|nr:hypothetical protein [Sphingomonas sp. Leaf343]KQR86196.1 hypothetical protein ASG07_15940 [Sphingomonas sp. Leaf343]